MAERKQPRRTRERILETSLQLFNRFGERNVTTADIAVEMEISPGNLYYHFRNKEAIVLAAYDQALRAYDEVWDRAGAASPTPETMRGLLQGTFDAQWRFRFLQRELPSLVQRDEALRVRYRAVQERRLAAFRSLVRGWVASGIAKPIAEERLEDLVTASWVVGDQWLAYLEAMGHPVDEDGFRRGARLILEIFRPHLSDEAAALL